MSTTLDVAEMQSDWEDWVDGLHRALGPQSAMAVLEQRMLRSRREHRCADCGAPGGEPQTPSRFLAAVDRYFFCASCDAYWRAKEVESVS